MSELTPGQKTVIAEQEKIESYSDKKLCRVAWTYVYIVFGKRAVDLMVRSAILKTGGNDD